MAIGDNWNDLSMLEIAGHPVLMGNAPDDLQTIAAERGWLTTCAHDAHGVAEAVYRALPELAVLAAVLVLCVRSNHL
jgi:hydroxymethylpyrimidine pyrophosphatase-like HAD family hydrolase